MGILRVLTSKIERELDYQFLSKDKGLTKGIAANVLPLQRHIHRGYNYKNNMQINIQQNMTHKK